MFFCLVTLKSNSSANVKKRGTDHRPNLPGRRPTITDKVDLIQLSCPLRIDKYVSTKSRTTCFSKPMCDSSGYPHHRRSLLQGMDRQLWKVESITLKLLRHKRTDTKNYNLRYKDPLFRHKKRGFYTQKKLETIIKLPRLHVYNSKT